MCVREEREQPGRKPVTVECARDTIAKLSRGSVGKSVGNNGYITSRDADPLRHLGMSRGDGECAVCERTWFENVHGLRSLC